jgi:hypothetical protein
MKNTHLCILMSLGLLLCGPYAGASGTWMTEEEKTACKSLKSVEEVKYQQAIQDSGLKLKRFERLEKERAVLAEGISDAYRRTVMPVLSSGENRAFLKVNWAVGMSPSDATPHFQAMIKQLKKYGVDAQIITGYTEGKGLGLQLCKHAKGQFGNAPVCLRQPFRVLAEDLDLKASDVLVMTEGENVEYKTLMHETFILQSRDAWLDHQMPEYCQSWLGSELAADAYSQIRLKALEVDPMNADGSAIRDRNASAGEISKSALAK